jgi:hypothetical protein
LQPRESYAVPQAEVAMQKQLIFAPNSWYLLKYELLCFMDSREVEVSVWVPRPAVNLLQES